MGKAETRTTKSLRNTTVGLIGVLLSIVISFITRSVFVRQLGVEYNGVNGLFTNVLQMLNMAELGFASATAFELYRPLKDGDEQTISAIMNFFAKVYRIIAAIVAVVGALCIPFLQYLIAEKISDLSFSLNQLRIYFALFLGNTVFSYLLAYKRTLIRADQNAYIISTVDYSSTIILNILQIVLLVTTKSFYAYLIIMIAKTIVSNIILHVIASKKYPYIAKYKQAKITDEDKKRLVKNVSALFLHRIGNVLVYSTASILISSLIGIYEEGVYANYAMIVNNVWTFVNIVFVSITASVGNLGVSENMERRVTVFKRVQFVANFLAVFSLVCYVCLFNDFIVLWLGKDYLFSLPVVIAISLNAVINYLRRPALTFKDGLGIFKQDWFKPIVESVLAIGLAIGLSFVWGSLGIFIGYSIATLFFAVPVENFIMFKCGFERYKKQFARQMLNLTLTLIFACGLTAIAYLICRFIPVGVGWFILEVLFCVAFSVTGFVLLTFKTNEFKYFKNLFLSGIKKILSKFKKSGEKEARPMQELTLREIQLAELDILIEFDRICRENDLKYSLSSGTLLGAIRHKGFIPWDDDIDVEMPRPDYEKFIKLINSEAVDLKAGYEFITDRGKEAKYPWIKILDTLYETKSFILNDGYSGLFIDIFPVDGYSGDIEKSLKNHKKVQKLRRLLAYNYLTLNNFSSVKKLGRKIYGLYAKLHKPYKLVEKINKISISYPYEDAAYAGVVYFKSPEIIGAFTKQEIENTIDVEFEGRNFSVYECYDKYLSLIYGDYMKIPEAVDRESHTLRCYRK